MLPEWDDIDYDPFAYGGDFDEEGLYDEEVYALLNAAQSAGVALTDEHIARYKSLRSMSSADYEVFVLAQQIFRS